MADSASNDVQDSQPTTDERPRQHKRTRAAMDPGTPRGDESESLRGLTSSTPVAKKGRVEGDDDDAPEGEGEETLERDASERLSRAPSSENIASSDTSARARSVATPPPQGNASAPGTEGRDTKHIRERVAAMKATNSETLNHDNSKEQEQDLAAASNDNEMGSTAETAAEVSVTAARLGDEQDRKQGRDEEIAQVAAEVNKSAEVVNNGAEIPSNEEREMRTEKAKVADEVSKVAAKVEKEDVDIAETAAETAKATESVPQTQPVAKSTSFVPYTGGASKNPTHTSSSSASSFSAFSSSSSPFASVASPPPPPAKTTPLESQKPKTKSSFSASPFLASSIPLAKKPETYTTSATPPSSASPFSSTSTLTAPSTPASKPLSANSPFSAFASTSGFASAAKPTNAFGTPSSSSTGARSAFSSYSAAPSAFASVPSTPLSKSSAPTKGSDDNSKDGQTSPTATTGGAGESETKTGSTGGGDVGRKIGEPEQPDENKRIYTEQETHTGEEGDKVVHNVRAKLFAMQDGNWVERGMGPLKVNLTKREGEKDGARIVMRADATHRLLLNSPLFKEFFIEVSNEKYVRFTIIEGSEPISYMARLGNPTAAESLVAAIRERTSAL